MKLLPFFVFICALTATTLFSCPTGIECDDEQAEEVGMIIDNEEDVIIGTDLVLTP